MCYLGLFFIGLNTLAFLMLHGQSKDIFCTKHLLISQSNNLANAAPILWHAYKSLPDPSNQVNWAGE